VQLAAVAVLKVIPVQLAVQNPYRPHAAMSEFGLREARKLMPAVAEAQHGLGFHRVGGVGLHPPVNPLENLVAQREDLQEPTGVGKNGQFAVGEALAAEDATDGWHGVPNPTERVTLPIWNHVASTKRQGGSDGTQGQKPLDRRLTVRKPNGTQAGWDP